MHRAPERERGGNAYQCRRRDDRRRCTPAEMPGPQPEHDGPGKLAKVASLLQQADSLLCFPVVELGLALDVGCSRRAGERQRAGERDRADGAKRSGLGLATARRHNGTPRAVETTNA